MKKYKCECGCSETDRVYKTGEIDFRRCLFCGLIFREKFPSDDELVRIYKDAYQDEKVQSGETHQESGGFAVQQYTNFLNSRFGSQNRDGFRILDFGAGTGALVASLMKAGFDARGLEFSKAARDSCFKHRCIDLYPDLSHVENGTLDVVLMVEVIEHLTALHATLQDIKRVLKPNGVLFITTPNIDGLRARIEGGGWKEARKKFHLFLFRRNNLKNLLVRAGYSKIKFVKYGPLQKRGYSNLIYARICQFFKVEGTLQVFASAD